MYYFGYGSNMLTQRIQARVPSAKLAHTAILDGYTLQFHKRSRDGSGKCNIVSSPARNARIHGVVFDVSSADLEALDEAEKRGRGYRRRDVVVQGPERPIEAFAYVAQPAYVDNALLPYDWYHALVLAGAREHGLPSEYISQIEDIRSYPDPNEDRRRRHQALLQEAGFPLLRN